MELLFVIATIVLVVIPLLIAATLVFVDRERLARARKEFRTRALSAFPFLVLLVVILGFNNRLRRTLHDISWWVGFEITPQIVAIEGHTVARIQEVIGGEWTLIFFSFMYVYGYVFLLVFPLIAYFLMDRLNMFKSLTVAYVLNYSIGLIFYTAFVAFGPRNVIPDDVGMLMHEAYPQLHLLTSEINEFTNVFPSLHTSLSATVMLFAWHTRKVYPRWVPIATFVGASVIMSTMYLAIHWIVDVVAGIGLAAFSYWIGVRMIEDEWFASTRMARMWSRVLNHVR